MTHWRKRYHIEQSGWIETGTAAILGWLGVIIYSAIFAFFIFLMFATIPKAKAQTSHVWVIVLHFNVGGIHAAVLPRDHPHAYDEDAACKRRIPDIRRRWERLELPMPEKITCERYEVK